MDQLMIALTGVVAAWVNQDPRGHVRRWACIVGLIGQPFWFYSTIVAGQWGTFAVTVGYTAAYVRGILYLLRPAHG